MAEAADPKRAALDDLAERLASALAPGLALARNAPDRSPLSWSVAAADGRCILTCGLVDRTFYWTWDDGVSNHYAKDAATMARVILDEMRRFGHLA